MSQMLMAPKNRGYLGVFKGCPCGYKGCTGNSICRGRKVRRSVKRAERQQWKKEWA